jgi:hypothetical protein
LAKIVIPTKELFHFLSRWWWAVVMAVAAGTGVYAIKLWKDQSEKDRLEMETRMSISDKCKHLPKPEHLPRDADINDRYDAMRKDEEITICQLKALAEIQEQRKLKKQHDF